MAEDDPKEAVREYVNDKLPFKSERKLAKRLRILEGLGWQIHRFEAHFGLRARVVLWLLALALFAGAGYMWASNTLPQASIAAALAHDLEFVRYRGNGLSIVYDHNLKETGRVQLNVGFFYALRIGFSLVIGIVVFFLFRRAYVKAAQVVESIEHEEESG